MRGNRVNMGSTRSSRQRHERGFGRPGPHWLLSEPARSAAEFGAMAALLPVLRRAPHGDGHGVLVLPGFMASDNSTRVLRWYLRDLGYRSHGWRLGDKGRIQPPFRYCVDQRIVRTGSQFQAHIGIAAVKVGQYAGEAAR